MSQKSSFIQDAKFVSGALTGDRIRSDLTQPRFRQGGFQASAPLLPVLSRCPASPQGERLNSMAWRHSYR